MHNGTNKYTLLISSDFRVHFTFRHPIDEEGGVPPHDIECIEWFCGTYIFTCMKVICILSSHAIDNTFLPHIALAPSQPMSGPNQ